MPNRYRRNMDRPSKLVNFVYRPIELLSETLERKLGLASVVIISLSAMLGSGLFVLPALVMLDMCGGTAPVAGIWLAYLLAAIAILPAAVSKGELSTAMPSSEGSDVCRRQAPTSSAMCSAPPCTAISCCTTDTELLKFDA